MRFKRKEIRLPPRGGDAEKIFKPEEIKMEIEKPEITGNKPEPIPQRQQKLIIIEVAPSVARVVRNDCTSVFEFRGVLEQLLRGFTERGIGNS